MSAAGLASVLRAPPASIGAEVLWRLRRRWWLLRHGSARPEPLQRNPALAMSPAPLLPIPPAHLSSASRQTLEAWCEHYLKHEFNVLGSGWKRVAGASAAAGAHYAPIDWHLDFISGHRWPADCWHRDLRIGGVAGADIKVPWELARMQHLPQLALAALGGIIPVARAAGEFSNQVADFRAANAVGWGIHWSNAMEVAIRVANWLLAWDLLHGAGFRFEPAFQASMQEAVAQHGRHIAHNLEWHPRYRANHYLCDLAGLVFCGAWLEGEEADGWLAFGIRGMAAETLRQFNPDGSGFEASTSYHRLAAETALFATAVAAAVPEDRLERLSCLRERVLCPQHGLRLRPLERPRPFGEAHFERLRRAARFMLSVTKPDGRVAQIGDNDSGRFAKLSWAAVDGVEEHLDHRPQAAALGALLGGAPEASEGYDAAIMRRLATASPGPVQSPPATVTLGSWAQAESCATCKGGNSCSRVLARGPGLTAGLRIEAFPDFGLYLYRSRRIWLAIRCGESGIEPLGAHAHNDQLAMELVVDGENKLRDPGSPVYTASPASRDAYRSVSAHDAPRVAGREPARLDEGMFLLRHRTGARCLYFGERGFAGVHVGYGAPVYRVVTLTDALLQVDDCSMAGPLDPDYRPPAFSPGYGLQEG